MIILDSSAAADVTLGFEPNASWVADRLTEDPDPHAPFVIDAEVLGVVRKSVLDGIVPLEWGEDALVSFLDLPIIRYPHLPFLPRAWELRENFHAPDALFVALAEELDAPLVTTDIRLARAPGHRARIVSPG